MSANYMYYQYYINVTIFIGDGALDSFTICLVHI